MNDRVSSFNRRVLNVLDYGAKGNGIDNDTPSIQAAVDECSLFSDGIVYFPKGIYLIGTIKLKSNTTIHLSAEAVLLGSTDIRDYASDIQLNVEGPSFSWCLIYAENARHITIEGEGLIEGRGRSFVEGENPVMYEDKRIRPKHIRFVDCEHISLRDVTLKDSGAWSTHMVNCSDIRIDNVKISNLVNSNNDGIDLNGCSDVFISNCNLRTGDDSICLKSTSRQCQNIVISNCILSSRTAAVKFGTSSRGGFKNITITNCVFYNNNSGAIKLLLVDGGVLENVTISNITMDNVGSPLFIRLGRRGREYNTAEEMYYGTPQENIDKVPDGVLRNIMVSNIQARVTGKKDRSVIMLTGVPGAMIENVSLSNMRITFPGGGTEEDACRVVEELETDYPEQWRFGVVPAYGIYMRHIKGVKLDNLWFQLENSDARSAIVCEDVKDAVVSNCRIEANTGKEPMLRLSSVEDVQIINNSIKGTVDTFVVVDNSDKDEVFVSGNLIKGSKC